MIRQAITCDICGNEKRQTNHWFVAYEHASEMRISGWQSRFRLRPETKHLCGQTCLHKLVDDFIARTVEARPLTRVASDSEGKAATRKTDTSLTSETGHGETESSGRLIAATRFPVTAVASVGAQPEVLAMRGRMREETFSPPSEPQFTSRKWRAEAWEREREREMHRTDSAIARRRSSA